MSRFVGDAAWPSLVAQAADWYEYLIIEGFAQAVMKALPPALSYISYQFDDGSQVDSRVIKNPIA